PQILWLAPLPVGLEGGPPDIIATVSSWAVAYKIECPAVGAERWLCFPSACIDGGAEVIGLAPLVTFPAGYINVTATQAFRPVAPRKKQVFAIRGDAMCAFVIQGGVDVARQQACGLPLSTAVPDAFIKIFAVVGLTRKDNRLLVGGEA